MILSRQNDKLTSKCYFLQFCRQTHISSALVLSFCNTKQAILHHRLAGAVAFTGPFPMLHRGSVYARRLFRA